MIKSVVTVLKGDVLGKILAAALAFMLARKLSVEDFGVYNYMLRMLALAGVAVSPFPNIYLRDHRYFRFEKYNFSYVWLSALLAAPFFLVLSGLVYEVPPGVFAAYYACLVLREAGRSYFNVYEEYKKFSLVYVLEETALLAAAAVLIFALGVTSPARLVFWTHSAALAMLSAFLLKNMDAGKISFGAGLSFLKKTYADSVYLLLYWSAMPLLAFMDMFFVERFLDNHQLGLYAFSLKIYGVSLIGLAPMLTVLRIRQIDVARDFRYMEFFRRNVKKVLLFSSGFYVLGLAGTFLVTLGFFREYAGSVWASAVLVSASFASYLTIPFAFLMACRKYALIFGLSLAALAVNFLINYFFVPVYGIMAAAASTFAAQLILNGSGAFLSYRFFAGKTEK